MTIKRILLTLVVVFVGTNAFAANHYIRAGATGANNGADWTNAWTSFSQVSWTRGDVYYIAGGSYGAAHLTKADSGTSVIELRGAIGGTGDHGTSTGWDDSFQGQALLSGGGSNILTNYWTINGQAVPGCTYPTNNEACYTIKIVNPANGNRPTSDNVLDLCGGGGAPNCTNYVLKYIDFLGTNTEGTNFTDEGIHCYPQCSNTTISHSYIHHVGCDLLAFNSFDSSPFLLEYNWIAYDDVGLGQISGGPAHCQGIEITAATITLRFNVWQDMQSSGAITDAAGGNAPISEWDIYGNIFFWDAPWIAKFTGNGAVGYDDGIVGLFSLSNSNGKLKFFNNTITSPGLAESQNCNAWAYYVTQLGVVATVYNNIWYGFDSSKCHAGASGPGTYDYNAYFSVSGGKQDNGSHSFSSNTNPFVNPSASTVAGFVLTADTQPGVQLGAPFNVDMLGTSRGASGIWDMGALQLSGTSASLPPVPQNLRVTSLK